MLQEFISELKRDGFALSKPFLFLVQMYGGFDRKMSILCHTASLPFWTAQTVPNRIYGYSTEVLADITFNPINLGFYVDRKWNVVKKFEEMRDKMFNQIDYSPEYYANYTFDLDIIALDNANNGAQVAKFNVQNCIIKNYNVQPLSWGAINTVQNVTLDIVYEKYDADFTSSPGLTTPGATGLMNRLIGAPSSISDEIGSTLNFDTLRQLAPDIAQNFNLGNQTTPPLTENDAGNTPTELRDTVGASFPRIFG